MVEFNKAISTLLREQTRRGHTERRLHREGTARRGDYTDKGDGTYTEREQALRRDTHGKEIIGRGDYTERGLHRKGTTRKADYTGKVEGTHKETHTERGHTRRTS